MYDIGHDLLLQNFSTQNLIQLENGTVVKEVCSYGTVVIFDH